MAPTGPFCSTFSGLCAQAAPAGRSQAEPGVVRPGAEHDVLSALVPGTGARRTGLVRSPEIRPYVFLTQKIT
jgi:hypothetical protein